MSTCLAKSKFFGGRNRTSKNIFQPAGRRRQGKKEKEKKKAASICFHGNIKQWIFHEKEDSLNTSFKTKRLTLKFKLKLCFCEVSFIEFVVYIYMPIYFLLNTSVDLLW